jgi:preprotein translocase subunit SecD
MVTKRALAVFLFCIAFGGCKTLNRVFRTGGTEFTVKVSTSEPNRDEIVAKAAKLIEAKANAIGLDIEVTRNPNVPDTLSVKYYGDQPLQPIRDTLLVIYRLELKKVANSVNTVTPYQDENAAKANLKDGQEVLPIKPDDPSDKKQFLIVEKQAVINGNDIRSARVVERWKGNYAIEFTLKPDAAARFGDWTGRNIKNYLAVVLNDEIQSYPIINGQIFDIGQIEGRFTKSSAEDIAISLNAGYLPATMTIVDEQPFGK